MKNLKLKVLILTLLILTFMPNRVGAAKLYLDPASVSAGVGSGVRVKVLFDSESEKINAIGATIKYPEKLLKLTSWSDGNSIINLWIQPTREEQGGVSLQGMIPGGYQGARGLILTLNFEVVGSGIGNVIFDKTSEALLNDGKGTLAPLMLGGLSLDTRGMEKTILQATEDKDLPEDFTPMISRDPNLFDNKYFLVFATQDKGSGIDHFEMSEVRSVFKPDPASWNVVESPAVLQDEELRSWIFVKAVDMKGNERMAVVPPTNVPVYQQPVFIIFLLLLVVGLIYVKRKKLF